MSAESRGKEAGFSCALAALDSWDCNWDPQHRVQALPPQGPRMHADPQTRTEMGWTWRTVI